MSHELQTPLWGSWLLKAQAEVPQPSMQPALPWDLRPISQHSPTVERLLSHLPHFTELHGDRWGWLAGEGQQVIMPCPWTSELTLCFPPAVFLLPTCPLSACQLCLASPGCPDAPLHNSWDLCDEPGSSTTCILVHCLLQLLCWEITNHFFLAIMWSQTQILILSIWKRLLEQTFSITSSEPCLRLM